MKGLLVLTAITIAAISYASTKEWKMVAESKDCTENIKILAKEGESFVYAVKGNDKTKLLPEDGSVYERDNKKAVSYLSQKSATGETISYTQPSVIESTPPKIQIMNSNKNIESSKCRMTDK